MKAAVEHLKQDFAFSERRACDLLRLPISTYRYRSSRCDGQLREKRRAGKPQASLACLPGSRIVRKEKAAKAAGAGGHSRCSGHASQ